MKNTLLATALLSCMLASSAIASENRCGWLHNPSPANWWLTDADGSWTIMTQGGGQEPDGMDHIGDISAGDYVRTNGNYGYACACMDVDVDDAGGNIVSIYGFRQLAIAQCAEDGALPAPE